MAVNTGGAVTSVGMDVDTDPHTLLEGMYMVPSLWKTAWQYHKVKHRSGVT
jgi:hypothetical protein